VEVRIDPPSPVAIRRLFPKATDRINDPPKFEVTVVQAVSEVLAGVTLTNPPEADARAAMLVKLVFAGW
jgi:hypothetical protein